LERYGFEKRFELPGRESPALVTGGGVGYAMQEVKGQHEGDGPGGGDGNEGANSHEHAALGSLAVVAWLWLHLWQERRKRQELGDVTAEGVEEADGGVVVAVEQGETVDHVDDDVVGQQREVGAGEGAGVG